MQIVHEAKDLYRRFHRGEESLCHEGVVLRRVPFVSRHSDVLLPQDRGIVENERFELLLFEPADGVGDAADLIVILHGLNETIPNKLFPWAVNLVRLCRAPVMVFPLALHLNRRPHDWIAEGRDLFAQRAALSGNAQACPFNAVLSHRLEEQPGRFFRAGLQSVRDLRDLARQLGAAQVASLPPGIRTHFLGYSAGGYVALVLLLADREGIFADSRLALFAGASHREGVFPESLLILDRLGAEAVHRFYGDGDRRADPEVASWLRELEEGRWFEEIFSGGENLPVALGRFAPRIRAFAGRHDQVITAAGMERALRGLEIERLELGVHEYPFSIEEAVPDAYTPTAGRRLLVDIARSADVAPAYRGVFATFVRAVAAHLRPGR